MSLLDEARSEPRRRLNCGLAAFAKTLPDTDRAELDTALADSVVSGSAIWRALVRRGFDLGSDVIRRHRQGMCSCGSC